MAPAGDTDVTGAGRPSSKDLSGEAALARLGLRFTDWAERWFPDAYVFVCLAVAVVAAVAMLNGATPMAVAKSFGDGFWSLITFTMQMAIMVIGGYVVASSPPVAKLIDRLAALPRRGAGAVGIRGGAQHADLAAQLGLEPDLQRAAGARAWRGAPICAWTIARRARRHISVSARPGRSGSARRRRSCRPIRQACPSPCCRSPASFRSRRRSFSGNRWSMAVVLHRDLDRHRTLVGALGRAGGRPRK